MKSSTAAKRYYCKLAFLTTAFDYSCVPVVRAVLATACGVISVGGTLWLKSDAGGIQVELKHRLSAAGVASRYEIGENPLRAWHAKDRAFDRLFTLIYHEFRDLAKSYLAREAHAHTLQPTALVNEAYLKLVEQKRVNWRDRSHLLAVGAIAMRRILVNHAIAAKRQKRGGPAARVTLHEDLISTEPDVDVLAVDQALHDLAMLNERHARLVELRFFAGLSVPEVAKVLGVSVSTIEKDWRFCSAWLKNALRR